MSNGRSINEVVELRERVARLEAALGASDARLRALTESLPFDFWIIDRDGRYAVVNSAFRRTWGDSVGKTPDESAPTPKLRALWVENNRRAFAGETVHDEVTIELAGEPRHYLNILTPIVEGGVQLGILGINIDITDRRRLAEQTERAQRMESVGVLAGGIAHDFNNHLMTIMGNIALARRDVATTSRAALLLLEADKACLHARGLTQQLLTFARGGQPVRQTTPLGDLVRASARLAVRGANCKCELQVQDDLWPADADAGQLEQVVQNLVLNASQSMPEGGTVRVSAENFVVRAGSSVELPAGRYVKIEVGDDGIGIADDALARIFEPYFTTKDKGRGLGLSVVYSIVRKHDGAVFARSQLGAGTTMHVYLPATEAPARASSYSLMVAATRSYGHVLVLDDEPPIRVVTARMLKELGYHAATASTVDEAAMLYERALATDDPFSAVILDLTIPGGPGGLECLQILRRIDPRVRAIVASGYSSDPVMSDPRRHGFLGVLAKPFSLDDLEGVLAAILPPSEPEDVRPGAA